MGAGPRLETLNNRATIDHIARRLAGRRGFGAIAMIVRLICPPRLLKYLEKHEKRQMEFRKHRPCEELRWTTEHPESRCGIGVLLRESGEVFTGPDYRFLRFATRPSATIETDDPLRVAQALDVAFFLWPHKYGKYRLPIGDYSEFGIHDIREPPDPASPPTDPDDFLKEMIARYEEDMARYGFKVPFLPELPPRPNAADAALTLDRPPEPSSTPTRQKRKPSARSKSRKAKR